jgi:hypothetical protein
LCTYLLYAKHAALSEFLDPDTLVEHEDVDHVLLLLHPHLAFEEAREHLHLKEVLEEGLLVGPARSFNVLAEVVAGVQIEGLGLLAPRGRHYDEILVFLEDADKKVEEGDADLVNILGGESLFLVKLLLKNGIQLFLEFLSLVHREFR